MIDSFSGRYHFLSNFYEAPITVPSLGLTFRSVEAAYQAFKCANPEDRAQFVNMRPNEAKRAGQLVAIKPDWELVKLIVMLNLLKIKFKPGSLLAAMLAATSPHELVEGNRWNDRFWGVCKGVGENHLGKLLMEIRDGA